MKTETAKRRSGESVNGEGRKIDCKRYSDCLDEIAKGKGQTFNCAKCTSYEKPSQTRVDEFEEELKGHSHEATKTQSGGEEMTTKERGRNQGKTCDVTGCDKAAYCLGKCMMHYSRAKRGQPVEGGPRKPGRQPEQTATTTKKVKRGNGEAENRPPACRASGPEGGNGDLKDAVEILIQCGFLSRAKLDAAMELVRE